LRDAVRATEENPTLCRYLSEHGRAHGDHLAADHFLFQMAENERQAHLIGQLLHGHEEAMTANQPSSMAAELMRNRRVVSQSPFKEFQP